VTHVVAFLRFWYDFVVGDDWRVAVGVVVALGITDLLADAGLSAWWVMPVAVIAILASSLWDATRPSRRFGRTGASAN
jgi:hypothetical protein